MAVCSTSSAMWNSLVRSCTKLHDESTTIGPSTPVSSTSATDRPSTPTW